MGYRKLENIDEKLIETIVHVGAEKGVAKTSIKRVANLCGVSHIVLLSRYGSTRGSWDAAAKYVDTRGMERMKSLIDAGNDRRKVWDSMLDYFLANPDEALYYISYVNTVGYDPTENNDRTEEMLYYAKIIFGADKGYSDRQYLMLWDYITSMQFYYAEKIIHGYLTDSEGDRAIIREIVFRGLDRM